MLLKRYAFSQFKVPLRKPFRTALREVHAACDLVIELEDEKGNVGRGTAASTPVLTGSSFHSMQRIFEEQLWPWLSQEEAWSQGLIHGISLMSRLTYANTSLLAAVEMALWDLWCRSLGLSLSQAWGGNAAQSFETDLTISVGEPSVMVQDALEARQRGFRFLKIKLGQDPTLDQKRMGELHQALGHTVQWRVDANMAWDSKETMQHLSLWHKWDMAISFVEQPLPRDDIKGMTFVKQRSPFPLVADESAQNVASSLRVLQEDASDIISVKLMKCGGLKAAREICEATQNFGKKVLISCMLETPWGCFAALHLASCLSTPPLVDLDPLFLIDSQGVSEEFSFQAPFLQVPQGAGIGGNFSWMKGSP